MRHLAILLLLAACSGGGGGGSSPPPPPPPPPPPTAVNEVVVSGLSPWPAACGGTGGTVYINSEVEPYVAVNPLNPANLVGVWQQDRWSSGSARGTLTGFSLDGGTTWTFAQPTFSECSSGNAQNNGDFLRATDPWVSFAPDGTAHQTALSTSGTGFTATSRNAMSVSRSADGGRTWSTPIKVREDAGAGSFNDKQALTADPTDARFVYVVWDRLEQAGRGPTWFARTADGGLTWEPARPIYDPGTGAQTIGNLIQVLPDGTLVNLMARLDTAPGAPANGRLEVIRSTDKGVTWSAPVTVARQQPLGARDPATGQPIRDGSIVAQMAVAPDGTIYVVWQDARFTGLRDAIAVSRSSDGGLTWSAPARVNSDPGVAAFTPQVHVRADGTIGVTYYDLRSDTPDPSTLLAEYWLARSVDGANWTETRIAAPFNINTAPAAAGGFFLGDYMGLASDGTTFVAFYTRTTGSIANRTDVFVARIPAAPAGRAYPPDDAKRAFTPDADFLRRVGENITTSASLRIRSQTPP